MNISFPVDEDSRISQKFGITPYSNVYKKYGLLGHNGIDWAVGNGSPIYACAPGVVIDHPIANTGYGNHLRILHNSGDAYFIGIYGHLQGVTVIPDQYVSEGQQIAKSDNTGFSTGPHLHFEIRPCNSEGVVDHPGNGYSGAVDPFPYLTRTTYQDEPVIYRAVVAANVLNVRSSPQSYPDGLVIGTYLRGKELEIVEVETVYNQLWGRVKNRQRLEWICLTFGENILATITPADEVPTEPPPPNTELTDAEKLAILWDWHQSHPEYW